MSSLDEKLASIVDDLAYTDLHDDDFLGTERVVAEIKAVFHEEGYHIECPPKVTDATLYPMLWSIANGYHKGQEWYNRFEKELAKEYGIVQGTNSQIVTTLSHVSKAHEAAKRAAGIEEDK